MDRTAYNAPGPRRRSVSFPVEMTARNALPSILAALESQHGPVRPPPPRGPFEMILWENVAYLASDDRRGEAFRALKKRIGTNATDLRDAPLGLLREVVGLAGILPTDSVAKLRRAAELACAEFEGDLRAVLRLPARQASRALRRFPGIGEPGAEKILLFCGVGSVLPLDSNGLRVLVRLGYGEEKKSYAATYRNAQEAAQRELATDRGVLQRAHLLLRRHGQEVCKRSAPRCPECAVAGSCAFARAGRARTSPRGSAR